MTDWAIKKQGVLIISLSDENFSLRTGKIEHSEINAYKSPLNRDDGIYLPQEYRALTLLDKN